MLGSMLLSMIGRHAHVACSHIYLLLKLSDLIWKCLITFSHPKIQTSKDKITLVSLSNKIYSGLFLQPDVRIIWFFPNLFACINLQYVK